MDLKEFDELIQRQPKCSFATIEGDKPRIRIFWTWFTDDENIYFHTPKSGNAYTQMLKNQNVELCYLEETNDDLMTRVSGTVHFINNDDKLIEKLLTDRPFLKPLSEKDRPEDVYGIFCLKKNEIIFR